MIKSVFEAMRMNELNIEQMEYLLSLIHIFNVEFVDIGGGLGVDYDGTRSANSESSVNYSIQELSLIHICRRLAKTGMLRSAHMLGNEEEIIFAATDLLADTKLAPELSNEAHYYRAKASLDAGKTDGAMEALKVLAKDTRNVYGAEAKYKVAQIYFDGGQTDKAERRC